MNNQHRSVNQQFTTSSEKHLENRINAHDLSQNEKDEIYKIAKERDQALIELKTDHEENKRLKEQNEEIDLTNNNQPQANFNLEPPTGNFKDYSFEAQSNVFNKFMEERKSISETANKQIDLIFANARDDSRGPDGGASKENNQDNDHDKNPDRG